MANLEKRMSYLEGEMEGIKRKMAEVEQKKEMGKMEKPIKWSSCWSKLGNLHVAKAKRGRSLICVTSFEASSSFEESARERP
ncbi:uncharacterized protein G2W53_004298 [Senna tora]|uniref:Uncharacterized protein n=1 Tax=Senna tora TaxID=362788 RepID=A0A834XCJ0_9FABA|nr:uncharacterized protein G2W53_004298 [Senna tora]